MGVGSIIARPLVQGPASESNSLCVKFVASNACRRTGLSRAIAQTTAVPGFCWLDETLGVVPPSPKVCGDWLGLPDLGQGERRSGEKERA